MLNILRLAVATLIVSLSVNGAVAVATDLSPSYALPNNAQPRAVGIVILCPSTDGSNTAVACTCP